MNKAERTNPDDIRVCNCADCGRELLAADDANLRAWNKLTNAARAKMPFSVPAGRVLDVQTMVPPDAMAVTLEM